MIHYHPLTKRLLIALSLSLSFLFAQVAEAELTVGTVDMNRILKEYRKTKEAEAKLNQAKDAAKKEFDDRTDAYKKELEEINALIKPTLSNHFRRISISGQP